MKKHIATAILLLLVSYAVTAMAAENRVETLRIMSYNVRNGIGLNSDGTVDKVAAVILASNPEVVALQELDSVTTRSGGRYILGQLASLTGMKATYAPAIDFDGGKYGIGILSKEEPLSIKRYALPGREESRALLVVEFPDYILFATHLSLTPEDQSSSLVLITELAKGYSKPLFLAGDLNFEPKTAQYKELTANFTILNRPSSATYPADKPTECIDYIAIYKGADNFATAKHFEVVDAPVESDHRPIFVEAEYGKILRTNPYLQNPTNGGITVLWQTNTPSYSWVEWGIDSTDLRRAHTLLAGQVMANNKLNKIRLDGIGSGKKYYYRIVSREIVAFGAYSKTFGGEYRSPLYTFELPANAQSDFSAVIFNDLHQNRATLDALMEVVKRGGEYDFTIFNGDCIDDPVSESQAISSIAYLNDVVGASCRPVVYIRGNHEIRGAFSMLFTTLFDYVGGQSYGAMNWGDTRIVMLDCGEDKPDETEVYYGLNDFDGFRRDQLDFLKMEHSSAEFKKASHRVLIHHIPLWGLDGEYNPCCDLWGAELQKRPYSVAINGHNHAAVMLRAGSGHGNPFPVMIGGGPAKSEATVMRLGKKGDRLTVDCYNVKGEKLFTYDSQSK